MAGHGDGRQSPESPPDRGRGQKGNGGRDVPGSGSRSRSKSRIDYERPPLENTGVQGRGDGDGARGKSRVVDYERRESRGGEAGAQLRRLHEGSWNWPSNFEELQQNESEQQKEQGLQEHGPQHGGESASSRDGDQSNQELKEKGRGDKTIESASLDEAQAMVNKWNTENLPDADQVYPEMVVRTFPAIRLATELAKEFDKQNMELGQLLTLSKSAKDISNPKMLDAVLRRELGGSMVQMENDYKILEESFPKDPSEVITRMDAVSGESNAKAQTMVDKWQAENLPDADRVQPEMILRHFGRVIWETTALEKANKDVALISVRQSLQETEKKLPKDPSEVLTKVRSEAARNALNVLDAQIAIDGMNRNLALDTTRANLHSAGRRLFRYL